jgi:hypothetical protein
MDVGWGRHKLSSACAIGASVPVARAAFGRCLASSFVVCSLLLVLPGAALASLSVSTFTVHARNGYQLRVIGTGLLSMSLPGQQVTLTGTAFKSELTE